MAQNSETLEGRIIAQRKLLARIVAVLEADGKAGPITRFLEDRSQYQDNEEDPGAVPSEALAIELAVADELRLILEESRTERVKGG